MRFSTSALLGMLLLCCIHAEKVKRVITYAPKGCGHGPLAADKDRIGFMVKGYVANESSSENKGERFVTTADTGIVQVTLGAGEMLLPGLEEGVANMCGE